MNRWLVPVWGSLLSLSLVTAAQGQLSAAPTCPVSSNLPAECAPPDATADATARWTKAQACLNALVRDRPNHFPGAVIGYQLDSQTAPSLYAAGASDTGFTGNTNAIISLASVSKPLAFISVLKMIQEHLASRDCALQADGTRSATCVFPQGVDTPLKVVLQRLDARNHTTIAPAWFTSQYLDGTAADRALQQRWREAILVRHLLLMTSGYPDITFIGHKFCDGPACAAPNEFVCPTAPTLDDPECWYSRLYNNYLQRRGGAVDLPGECKPRLTPDGPRLADFQNYYNGVVYNATRMAQRFERRYVAEPGLQSECVFIITPNSTVPDLWRDGREATLEQLALFYLGAPLQSAPGTVYHYSQPNVLIATWLVQATTGIPFNVYVRNEIFQPLQMKDTFFIVDTTRAFYAPDGAGHFVVHDPKGPGDHSTDEKSTKVQYDRMLDIKRVPRNRNWVVPHIAAPLHPNFVYGADKNWDEGRDGWRHPWPEGGAYSTASDLLRFLKFFRDGRAPDGRVLLQPEYLALALQDDALDVSPRTLVFVSGGPHIVAANGLWGTWMARDTVHKLNMVVLPQVLADPPHGGPYAATNCEFTYGGVLALRGAIQQILGDIR